MTYKSLKIFGDGGSRGNPGPSAAGFVISSNGDLLETGGQYLGVTTNNQAEYAAVRLALEAAKKYQPELIEFHLDSLLVVNQLNGVFRVKKPELKPVHQAIKDQIAQFAKVTFTHVRREYNQLADAEVNRILDKQSKNPS